MEEKEKNKRERERERERETERDRERGASVAEWLERVVAVREVSGFSSGLGGRKNICRRKGTSNYVSFRMAVERRQFNTLNTHDTKPRNHNNTSYKCLTHWKWISIDPTRCRSLISSRMTYVVCLRKSFPPTSCT